MKRRDAILVGVSAVASPYPASGQVQQRMLRTGILAGDMVAPHEMEAFIAGLRDQGLVEGRNLIIDRRYAHGRQINVPGLARNLADTKPDAVIST